jgi:hypothetical protein
MVDAAFVFAAVFAGNLLPALGPPVFAALRLGLDVS